ncbi:MAG: response regulator [Bacteroidales bacterium]|nr:response regulator [Bacteroidales bacterium]
MRKLNILLAEDDEMIERLTAYYLRHNGHEVDIAKNGNEAVRKFKDKKYDFILMDIQMPEMDGLQAVREIRKIESDYLAKGHTTIIAITTNPDKDECLKAGMDGYTQKPFKIDVLSTLFSTFSLS